MNNYSKFYARNILITLSAYRLLFSFCYLKAFKTLTKAFSFVPHKLSPIKIKRPTRAV